MTKITNSRNEKEISSVAEDVKQIREIYEQLNAYKFENVNEMDMVAHLACLIPRANPF